MHNYNDAVSYTHLDVYKRQRYSLVFTRAKPVGGSASLVDARITRVLLTLVLMLQH